MINKKAQSMLEYALLIVVVASAFLAMNVYIQRAVNARLHSIELEISPVTYIYSN
jgi:Flp pilus assembly pilin Flp